MTLTMTRRSSRRRPDAAHRRHRIRRHGAARPPARADRSRRRRARARRRRRGGRGAHRHAARRCCSRPGSAPRGARPRATPSRRTSSRPGLGLSEATRDRLTASIGAVVHCAASVSFTLELEDARRINVEGTREIMQLAREAQDYGVLDRVVHVSTAYVAGERDGRARERQGDIGQDFRNTYERTKLEAEQVVHDSGLPAAIVRPSVIVGDSKTGWTPCFNVIYWPLAGVRPRPVRPDPRRPGRADRHRPGRRRRRRAARARARTRALRRRFTSSPATRPSRTATSRRWPPSTSTPRRRTFVGPGVDPSAEVRAGVFMSYFRVRCVFDALRGRPRAGDEAGAAARGVLPGAHALRPRGALGQEPLAALGGRPRRDRARRVGRRWRLDPAARGRGAARSLTAVRQWPGSRAKSMHRGA